MTEHVWRDHIWDMSKIKSHNNKSYAKQYLERHPKARAVYKARGIDCPCFICLGAKARRCIHCGATWLSHDGSFNREGIYADMSCEEYTVYMKKKRMDDALS